MSIKAFAMTTAALSTAIYVPLVHAQSNDTDVAYNTFWSGTLQVTQTANAEDVLSLAGITYAATPGGGSLQTSAYDPVANTGSTTWLQLLSDSTYSNSSVQTVTASSAAITYKRNGQSVTLKNFELDAQLGTVYADISSSEGNFVHQRWLVKGESSGTTGQPGEKPWNHSEGGYTGLVLDGDYFFNGNSTSSLGILSRGLGLTDTYAGILKGVDFGNVSYSADYLNGFYWPWELPPKASLVPEPSTYALMLMGLVCLGLAASRRQVARV